MGLGGSTGRLIRRQGLLIRLKAEAAVVRDFVENFGLVLAMLAGLHQVTEVFEDVKERLSAELVLSGNIGARLVVAFELGQVAPVSCGLFILVCDTFEFEIPNGRSIGNDLTDDLVVLGQNVLTGTKETSIGRDRVRLEPVVGGECVKVVAGVDRLVDGAKDLARCQNAVLCCANVPYGRLRVGVARAWDGCGRGRTVSELVLRSGEQANEDGSEEKQSHGEDDEEAFQGTQLFGFG